MTTPAQKYKLDPDSLTLLQMVLTPFSALTSPEDAVVYNQHLVAFKTNAFYISNVAWHDEITLGEGPTCFGYVRRDEIFSSVQTRSWHLIALLDASRAEDSTTGVTALTVGNVQGISMRLAAEPEIRRIALAIDSDEAFFRPEDAEDVLAKAIAPLKVADYFRSPPTIEAPPTPIACMPLST